jgi:hypothetical protein
MAKDVTRLTYFHVVAAATSLCGYFELGTFYSELSFSAATVERKISDSSPHRRQPTNDKFENRFSRSPSNFPQQAFERYTKQPQRGFRQIDVPPAPDSIRLF